jgi:hypothetical protein
MPTEKTRPGPGSLRLRAETWKWVNSVAKQLGRRPRQVIEASITLTMERLEVPDVEMEIIRTANLPTAKQTLNVE